MFNLFKHLFNRKSDKEVKAGMEKEDKKPGEETEEGKAPVEEASEVRAEPSQAPEKEPQGRETDMGGATVGNDSESPEEGEQTPETPSETPTTEYVSREEFDSLKADIADIKALIQNLPKTSELIDPAGQQELDKLTALKAKWNS